MPPVRSQIFTLTIYLFLDPHIVPEGLEQVLGIPTAEIRKEKGGSE